MVEKSLSGMITAPHIYDHLGPEEIEDELARSAIRFNLAEGAFKTAEDLRDLLGYFRLLVYDRQIGRAGQVLVALHNHANAALEEKPGSAELLDLAVECNLMSMSFLTFDSGAYAELPYFEEILRLTEGQTGHLRLRHHLAEIGLINNYKAWLQMGGNPEALPTEVRQNLNDRYINLEASMSRNILAFEQAHDWALAIPVGRALGRFLLLNGHVDRGNAQIAKVLEHMPQHPGFAPTDTAELKMDYGQWLLAVGKPQLATEQFQAALAIFLDAGDDFELFAIQAESLLEAAKAFADAPPSHDAGTI